MPDTTTRLGLTQPLGTDATAQLRESITGNATTLDNAVIATSGTLADLPTSDLVFDQEYYATDTDQWFKYTGSEWVDILTTSSWAALTLGNSWSNVGGIEGYAVAARLTGDYTQLSGIMTADPGNGDIFATLPAALCPSKNVQLSVNAFTGTGSTAVIYPTVLIIYTNGQCALHLSDQDWPSAEATVALDGLSFRVI